MRKRYTTSQRRRHARHKAVQRQRNRCFYCDVQMTAPSKPGEMPLPTSATLEHTISRNNPLRGRVQRLVAACWKCNNERCGQ